MPQPIVKSETLDSHCAPSTLPVGCSADGGAFGYYSLHLLPTTISTMATGTIKKKMEKGFGFISPSDGSADVFFHLSACNGQFDTLQEGQTVSFDMGMGPKGPKAENVAAA